MPLIHQSGNVDSSSDRPLVLEGLGKNFGTVQALQDVSVSVEPGEVFGYLGPNGAGKTTTIRIALGLVHASAGTASLFGRPPSDAASRQRIGFLPGDLHLYAELTARQLLDFFAGFRPDRPSRRRVELMERLALDEATLRRRIKFLSHGTRQKLGIIVAMQHDPDLLLLDEPSTGLDPLVQQSFRELIRDFARRGGSVLLSSHLLDEVQNVCGRVAILRAGRLVALESIDGLRSNMVRRLTVRFAGSIPAELHELPQVVRWQASGNEMVLWVRGEVSGILRALADANVSDMVFPEADLEDIFFSYYRGQPGSDA